NNYHQLQIQLAELSSKSDLNSLDNFEILPSKDEKTEETIINTIFQRHFQQLHISTLNTISIPKLNF
ncbi:5657_t:CDS:1, partial [Scutellospora calospora]